MSPAEIEKLKALERAMPASGCVYYRDNEKPVADLAAAAVKALPRLLEERERLLEALRWIANESMATQYNAASRLDAIWVKTQPALTFAEAPSRRAVAAPRCRAHDAALANAAFFECGCRYIAPAPAGKEEK